MPDTHALNSLDCIVLGIIIWSVGWAAWRGFSHEIFSILGLIAAFIITSFTGHMLDGPLAGMLPDNAMARMFSRAIIFLGCIIVINIIAGLGAKSLRAILSRIVDHSMGLLFGFIRAALLVILPFLLVNLYIDPKVYPDWLTESHSYPFMQGGAHLLRQFIPESQIHDDERTDFGAIKKASADKEKLDDAINGIKPEKTDKKSKDSTGNFDVKELITTFKELMAK